MPKLYEFHELDEYAKQNVRERFWSTVVENDYDWADSIVEDFCYEMRDYGFDLKPHRDVYFSGFYSQGDGASFFGQLERPLDWIKETNTTVVPVDVENLWVNITGNSFAIHYDHHKTMTVEWEYQGDLELTKEQTAICEEFAQDVLEWAQSKALELYRKLQSTYEFMFTDEYLIDFYACYNDGFDKYGDEYDWSEDDGTEEVDEMDKLMLAIGEEMASQQEPENWEELMA